MFRMFEVKLCGAPWVNEDLMLWERGDGSHELVLLWQLTAWSPDSKKRLDQMRVVALFKAPELS
jgi:hypothetical protein